MKECGSIMNDMAKGNSSLNVVLYTMEIGVLTRRMAWERITLQQEISTREIGSTISKKDMVPVTTLVEMYMWALGYNTKNMVRVLKPGKMVRNTLVTGSTAYRMDKVSNTT